MKVAIVGAAHWHVPLHEAGLTETKARITAVWDEDPGLAAAFARRHGARVFASAQEIAAEAGCDLAFVFGRPAAMPRLARPFIERGTPLSLEKPCGIRAADVAELCELAAGKGGFVAVPLIQRYDGLGRALLDLFADEKPTSLAFRFVAGPPQRYLRAGCPWMLDPAESGGGALINLGIHFVDLALALTRAAPEHIACTTSRALHGTPVEDLAALTMRMAGGAVVTIEAGYGYPDGAQPPREFRISAVSRGLYVQSCEDGLQVTRPGGATHLVPASADTDASYATYVRRVLDDLATGRKPLAGLAEMAAALAVVDAAYRDAGQGRAEPA